MTTIESARDPELAYREYVAWALLIAVQETRSLLQANASLACINDALRYVSELNDLTADQVHLDGNTETIRRLVEHAKGIVCLTFVHQQSH